MRTFFTYTLPLTTNLEALACGVNVITFDTGGSPESLKKIVGSKIVDQGNLNKLYNEIVNFKCDPIDLEEISKLDKYRRLNLYINTYKIGE